MSGSDWEGVFGEVNAKMQRLNLERQLEPTLINLNKAITENNRQAAAGFAQSMAQAIGQIRDLADSAAVCNQIVALMSNISVALTAFMFDTRIRAMTQVEKWQTDNSAKVILDWESFKVLVFNNPQK